MNQYQNNNNPNMLSPFMIFHDWLEDFALRVEDRYVFEKDRSSIESDHDHSFILED